MTKHAPTHLEELHKLSINRVLCIIQATFFHYLVKASREVSIAAIDNHVNHLNDPQILRLWQSERRGKYPHMFLLWIFARAKYDTLERKQYSRVSSEGMEIPKTTIHHYAFPADPRLYELPITREINAYLDKLHFYDAGQYLGELAGAWMLTCPVAYIDAAYPFVKSAYRSQNLPGLDKCDEEEGKEIRMIFALKYGFHALFQDYDLEPQRAFQNYHPKAK